jgi:hypothetical protein
MKQHDLAKALSETFITLKRDNGEAFIKLTDDRPEWMFEAVRDAHCGMSPDDRRYEMIKECVDTLLEFDDWEDTHQMIDRLVDVYHTDRVKWLASHLDRGEYCTEAIADGMFTGESSIWDILGEGQYREYRQIYDSLINSLNNRAAHEAHADDSKD